MSQMTHSDIEQLARMLLCVISTPFGSPVVPELSMIIPTRLVISTGTGLNPAGICNVGSEMISWNI